METAKIDASSKFFIEYSENMLICFPLIKIPLELKRGILRYVENLMKYFKRTRTIPSISFCKFGKHCKVLSMQTMVFFLINFSW